MSTKSLSGRILLYSMLFFSGAAGLVYQVVWHKYLAILLGAHSKATAVVLAIFLGGISLGYWVFGRLTRRPRWNLLTAYAVVEVGLTLWAFAFPYLFSLAMDWAPTIYQTMGLENPLIDIALSVALIGFPTFLMGGTLPLLTQGMAIDVKEASQTHARIYGFNTVGACLGCALAGYLLIPSLGLAMSSTLAGLVNGIVAFVAYFAFAKYWTPEFVAPTTEEAKVDPKGWPALAALFSVGFLSGFYVLSLETVFIRLMGLATGSSNYTFTLVVSIFVFGLGIGSLLVRKISTYREGHLFWCQMGVGAALLVLYSTGDSWPYYVHLVRILFKDAVYAYPVFQVALAGLFAILFLVPVGLCGLILPLCFHLVKDRADNLGYRVGQLYGLNTVGAVLGALLGGYYLLYFIDLDELFRFCIGLSLVSAAISGYLYLSRQNPHRLYRGAGGIAFAGLFGILIFSPSYSHEIYTQPFRNQSSVVSNSEWPSKKDFEDYVAKPNKYLIYKDGPNSTVAIGTDGKDGKPETSRTVFVNGKSDGNTSGDSYTMLLTGHLPALFSRSLENSCVIGFGTGMSIGALARYDEEISSIDVVEISSTLVDNAHLFDPYNGNVSSNPKVNFHTMDAFRFLEGTDKLFGTIISEPSNPWVVGVENLYSSEFYEIAKRKLLPGGIYVQWLQTYSFNNELFEMVLKTISNNFKHVMVYQMMGTDWALIASDLPFNMVDVNRAKQRMVVHKEAAQDLAGLGLERIESILALEMIPQGLAAQISEGSLALHLDFPRLSNGAAEARFVQLRADVDGVRRQNNAYYAAVDHFLLRKFLGGEKPSQEVMNAWREAFCDHKKAGNPRLCRETLLGYRLNYPKTTFRGVHATVLKSADYKSLDGFRTGRKLASAGFTREDLNWVSEHFAYFKTKQSPISYLPFSKLTEPVERCLKTVAPDDGTLYGECLLQKAALLETLDSSSMEFKGVLDSYLTWIGSVSEETTNYSHFKEAGNILQKLKNRMMAASAQ